MRLGCYDDKDHLRYLLDVATAAVEHNFNIAAGLQVREMTFHCFPFCGGPILLDVIPVWDAAQWAFFTDEVEPNDLSASDPIIDCSPWKLNLWTQIQECFVCNVPPVEISVGSSECGCEPICLTIGTDFRANNARTPVELCLIGNCCTWPCTCCGCDCDQITVRFLAGDLSDCGIEKSNPRLAHQIIMMAGLLYETPELGGVNKPSDIVDMMDRMGLGLKWRP